MLSRTSEHKQTTRYANNLIMRLLFYPRSYRRCLIQRDRNTCSNLVLPWSIYSRKNWFFFAGCNHSVINHYKRKRVQSICAGIPLFTLPGTNHFTYRLIESSFDPKSAPNSNRNRLPRNWPSSPIRATTCWSCSKLSNTVPQLNSNKQELLHPIVSWNSQRKKDLFGDSGNVDGNEMLRFFSTLSLSFSSLACARNHPGMIRVVTRNENWLRDAVYDESNC